LIYSFANFSHFNGYLYKTKIPNNNAIEEKIAKRDFNPIIISGLMLSGLNTSQLPRIKTGAIA
jgi:hypothetical protein